MYGKEPPVIKPYVFGKANVDAVDFEFSSRDRILKELKENIGCAQQRMVSQANKRRQPVEFEVGQSLYLKLQPYYQISVHGQVYSKFGQRYYRPLTILKRVGKVTYKLSLPKG